MKVAFHDYSLHFKDSKRSRRGALVRFTFSHGYGYADCHPWPEFGDLSLEEQKQSLREGKLTSLTAKTFYFAKIDAEARAKGQTLLKTDKEIKNHFLLLGQSFENCESFDCIKMKLQGDDYEISKLNELMQKYPVKWRFDFNLTSSLTSFYKFLDSINLSQVDFIEDPFPFNETLWRKIEEEYHIQLAADFEKKKLEEWYPSVLIVKPAIDFLEAYHPKKSRIIITSYLAHPLEQMTAAYTAMQLNNGETMGLFSHSVFETNCFSECFGKNPETFYQNLGLGFGFDKILENLEWDD